MKYISLLLVSIWILIIACNDPIGIGSDVLDQESANVLLETIPITATTVTEDSLISFYSGGSSTSMVGNLDDAAYGRTEATAYFNATFIGLFPEDLKDINQIDSVVMIFGYDTLGRYAQENIIHDLELYRLATPFSDLDPEIDTLYTFDELEIESTPIWSGQKLISYQDSVTVESYVGDTTLLIRPMLRIPLDATEWADLFASEDTITSDRFRQIVPGFALKSTTENSVIGLNLNYDGSTSSPSSILFHHKLDTVKRITPVPLGARRHNQVIHDNSGSELASVIGVENSDVLFLQPQGGAELEIDLSAILLEDPFVMNSARLELTVVEPLNAEGYPVPTLIAATHEEDGTTFNLTDFAPSNRARYGGTPIDGEMMTTYTLDITAHLDQIRDGNLSNNKIRLYSTPRISTPNRTKIYGPNHPVYPLVLKVVKTIP